MSVQLEDGFTQIANELLENLPRYKFNGTQLRIIMVVWRFTYGFKRKDHEMSLTYFVKATGLGKTQIDRELTNLIDYKVLIVTEESTYTKSRRLGFNKNYSEWSIEYSQQISVESAKTLTVSKNADEQSANMRTPTVSKNADQERKVLKENLKENDTTTKSPEIILQDEFCRIHTKGEWTLKQKEYQQMKQITSIDIPLEFILKTMVQMFEYKQSKSEKVTSFSFYYESIIEAWNAKKGGKNVVPISEGIRQGFTNEHDRPFEEQPEWKPPSKYRDPETDLPDVSGR